MRLPKRTRVAVLAGLSVIALLTASTPPAATEASWQDTELSSGSFTAVTIPAPTLNGQCSYNPGLLGPYVRILWKAPDGYAAGDAELQYSATGLGAVLAPVTGYSVQANTTGSAAGGYVTDVNGSVVGNLLGLGVAEYRLAIVMKRYGWTSKAASVEANTGILVGIESSCTNLPPEL